MTAATGGAVESIGVVSDLQKTFAGYLRATRSGVARSVVEYVRTPMLVSGADGMTVLESAGDVEAYYDTILRRLASLSYARTEVHRQEVEVVNDRTAVVQISGTRRDSEGSVIEPIAAFYIFNLVGQEWRMSLMAPSVVA